MEMCRLCRDGSYNGRSNLIFCNYSTTHNLDERSPLALQPKITWFAMDSCSSQFRKRLPHPEPFPAAIHCTPHYRSDDSFSVCLPEKSWSWWNRCRSYRDNLHSRLSWPIRWKVSSFLPSERPLGFAQKDSNKYISNNYYYQGYNGVQEAAQSSSSIKVLDIYPNHEVLQTLEQSYLLKHHKNVHFHFFCGDSCKIDGPLMFGITIAKGRSTGR